MLEQILTGLMYPFLFFSMYFQIFLLISFFEGKRKIKREEKRVITDFPSVTVAIPCWNEEKTLSGTLDSLLKLIYPKDKLKFIIVDDGSTDETFEIAKQYKEKYPDLIEVIKKENGGKHTAMNLALSMCNTELFGCLDADSFVEPKTLSHIVGYFEWDKDVMAVTPCVHIKAPKTLVQRMQAIEYLLGVFIRKAYGEIDAIQVTPGPFSIFKKEVFDKLGPYKKAHNTEDFEITLRMHKNHMKIVNSHKATVYTLGPSTAYGFFKQHLRWARGFIENALDYREMFFKKKYGNFGLFTLPGGFMFVFYAMYTAVFIVYNLTISLSKIIAIIFISGLNMPHFTFKFDFFYFNTNTISFVTMVLFTMLLFVLYIGRELTEDKQQFYRNFPVFFVLFPLFVPLYVSRAVFDIIFSRKNEWVLQDNKRS